MLPEPSEETVTVFYRGRRDGGFDGSTLLFTLDRGDKHVYAAMRIAEELTLSDGITDDKLEELAVLVGLPRLRALIEDEGVNAFFAGPVQRSLDLTIDTVPKRFASLLAAMQQVVSVPLTGTTATGRPRRWGCNSCSTEAK